MRSRSNELHRIRLDTLLGMGISIVIALCVVIATAAGQIACGSTRFGEAGVDATERQERILTMVHALAQEAMKLPAPERQVFVRRRIVEARVTLARAYASNPKASAFLREFADHLQQWTTAQVKALEQSRAADDQSSTSGPAQPNAEKEP
jgi:ethanolamine ammonia-lyase small subunit